MSEEINHDDPNSIHYKGAVKPNKMYFGNFREKFRQSGDKFLTGFICLDDIQKVPEDLIMVRNGKRFIKVVINPFVDGVNEHGNTHSCLLDDTFKPVNKES